MAVTSAHLQLWQAQAAALQLEGAELTQHIRHILTPPPRWSSKHARGRRPPCCSWHGSNCWLLQRGCSLCNSSGQSTQCKDWCIFWWWKQRGEACRCWWRRQRNDAVWAS
jgi:hypothetical protein